MNWECDLISDWGPPDSEDGAQFRFLVLACGYLPESSAGIQVGLLGVVFELVWWQE